MAATTSMVMVCQLLLHIRVLFVIIIHIVQILPLNGLIYQFPAKPILYHYSVSLPINQEKNN